MKLHSMSSAMGFTLLALGALAGCSRPAGNGASATADTAAQPSFATPEDAATALIQTVQQGDAAALQKLLGPGTAELVSSGDAVADQKERETFLERYRAYHEFAAGDPDDLVLMVGEDRWPLPIPLVRRDQRWAFDGEAGTQEVLLRRIGANELRTINVMRGYVEAQNLYVGARTMGSPRAPMRRNCAAIPASRTACTGRSPAAPTRAPPDRYWPPRTPRGTVARRPRPCPTTATCFDS